MKMTQWGCMRSIPVDKKKEHLVLGSTGKGAIGSLQVVLSRYIFAMIDDFSVVVDP